MKHGFFVLTLLLVGACGDASIQVPEGLRLLDVSPHHGATQITLSPNVVITFNDEIDPASLDDDSLRLDGADTTVPTRRLLSRDGRSVSLVPTSVLLGGVSYQVVIEFSVTGHNLGPLGTSQQSRFRTRAR